MIATNVAGYFFVTQQVVRLRLLVNLHIL
jgi:hypothetical protein